MRREAKSIGLLLTLLWSSAILSIAQAPPPFSAAVTISRTNKEGVSSNSATLYFDGKHRWRWELNQVGVQDFGQLSELSRGVAQNNPTDFFIQDEERHVLYKFLAHPLTPEVFYHEFDVSPITPSVPEALGMEDWTLYDRSNPCSGFPAMKCTKGTAVAVEKLSDFSLKGDEVGTYIEIRVADAAVHRHYRRPADHDGATDPR